MIVSDDIGARWSHIFSGVHETFLTTNETEKLFMLKKLIEFVNPPNTSLLEPVVKTNNRGRPRKITSKQSKSTEHEHNAFEYVESIYESCSEPLLNPIGKQKQKAFRCPTRMAFDRGYIDQLPSHLREYIIGIEDVVANGDCGFRAVTALLGFGENAWPQVRCDLLEELQNFKELYEGAYIENGSVQQ